MVKVITYGTYDLLHYGHIRLLERAKELGDYLIVGITADGFDMTRGKINVQQSLMERIEAVRKTGIADEIIIEEYEGQKIDDIIKYDVDIFTVGSDWVGKFDYLNEYCKVVYLDRTEGISSSEIREAKSEISLGLAGSSSFVEKVAKESEYVNGIKVFGVSSDFNNIVDNVDAVYIRTCPENHYDQIKSAIERGKNILCESPISLKKQQTKELFELADEKKVVLFEALKTAYSTAYCRLLLLVKSGLIGEVVSVEATCTSLSVDHNWSGIHEWGPTALLPVFQILGTEYFKRDIVVKLDENKKDLFTKIDFVYKNAVASIKFGNGVKSEGDLIISGTKGYLYVPAPWWKTDYFEVRFEDANNNKRYFYQLDGEGIRYELVSFIKAISRGQKYTNIDREISLEISDIMDACKNLDETLYI